jgi:orotidine-5'-phosphate decarboxylase
LTTQKISFKLWKAKKNMSSFMNLLNQKWKEGKFVCVGLDSDYSKLPESVKDKWKDKKTDQGVDLSIEASLYEFNKAIIDATHDLVSSYKINSAFYEYSGLAYEAMLNTFHYIKRTYPEIPVILDAKRADIGNTNEGYVRMAFETLKADAITVHPYMGRESLKPFLDQKNKGIIVLVKTSNPGSGEFQELEVDGMSLYQVVAEYVSKNWNKNGNVGIVVGATYPDQLRKIREIVGDIPILIPGIGAQGGDLEDAVKAGKDSHGQGMIISSSRAIIYASNGEDFAEKAREETEKMDKQIKEILNNV